LNLKDEYNKAFIESLANELSVKASSFNKSSFTKDILTKDWNNKELKERIRCVTENINAHLTIPYDEQIGILVEVAPKFKGLQLFVFPDFVEVYGLNDISTSFRAMEIFTELFTSEMAIRPFIEKYPEQAMQQMSKWSQSNHLKILSMTLRLLYQF
jgi:3-methyladenine DNA glycosylase AlkC